MATSPRSSAFLPHGSQKLPSAGSSQKTRRKKKRFNFDPTGPHHLHEPNFRPQPGDVIVRKLVDGLDSTAVYSVMGIIRIYDDAYYFMYAEGEAHRVKYTFRKGDLILRFGHFTSKFYTWSYHELVSLYLLHCDGLEISHESPGLWYKVAQKQNPEPYVDAPDQTVHRFSDENAKELLSGGFRLDRGDFLVHQMPVEAPDRPWGVSYELRVVEEHFEDLIPAIWSRGDICVRVRMQVPPSDETYQGALNLHVPHVTDVLESALDEYVPMYVYGFLCVGKAFTKSSQRDPVTLEYIVEGVWRYLGFDHRIFTNFQKRLEANEPQIYPCNPVRPGDLILNLDEAINTLSPGLNGRGHILIARDGPQLLHGPENLPGSVIIRLGYFVDEGARANIYIHREEEMDRFALERDDFLAWAEITTPEVYIHHPLREGWWINGSLTHFSELPGRPLGAQAPQWDRVERGVGLQHPPHLFFNINQPLQHALVYSGRDVIFNKNPSPDHTAMFARQTIAIWNWHGRTRLSMRVELQGFEEDLQRYLLIEGEGENTKNLFFWEEGYVFQDGDQLIRHNIEENAADHPEKWIVTVELFSYHSVPLKRQWGDQPVWVFRGRDEAVLPVREFPEGQPRLLFND